MRDFSNCDRSEQAAENLADARRDVRNRAADGLRPLARGQIGLIVSGAVTRRTMSTGPNFVTFVRVFVFS